MSLTAQKWQDVMAMSTGVQYTLGPNATDRYLLDPKRLGFLFARYKFAAKMLRDCASIIDVGCGDGMGTATFLEDTRAHEIVGIDQDTALLEHARKTLVPAIFHARSRFDANRLTFTDYNVVDDNWMNGLHAGVSCLDVIEHVDGASAHDFIAAIERLLHGNGIAVIGTPSQHASQFASPQSQVGHINLYTPDRLREELSKRFRHTLLFGMNDEMIHVGFDKLWHYIIAIAIK